MGVKFFQKLGHQHLKNNLAFMRLGLDVKGLFFELRLMAGDAEGEDGCFPLGASKRATVEDLVLYYSDGTKARRNWVEKCLKQLVRAGVVKVLPSKVVKLATFEAEQALGRTTEANRKRAKAREAFGDEVAKARGALVKLFTRAEALPYEVAGGAVKRVLKCYQKKLEEVLNVLRDEGFLCVGEDGVCTLAPLAPASVPPVAGAGAGGAGSQYSGKQNIPVEPDSASALKDTNVSSAGTAEAHARAVSEGGTDAGASGAHPLRGAPSSSGHCVDSIHSPEDAWLVSDPLHASELFLSGCKGWDERSRFPMRKQWKELRRDLGPKVAAEIWRSALFDIVTEKADGASIRSFVAVFTSRVRTASVDASLKSVEGDEG